MANLADSILAGKLDARIEIVVGSRDGAAGLERARERGLEARVLARKRFARDGIFDADAYTAALLELLSPHAIDLIVLGGFMSMLGRALFDRYPVVNIHPALLPRYGGAGMYGHHVHEAVLAAGDRQTGCTVHFADPEYDHGPILAQSLVDVLPGDTAETLAERVQAAERMLYPEAIGWIAAGLVRIEAGRLTVTTA